MPHVTVVPSLIKFIFETAHIEMTAIFKCLNVHGVKVGIQYGVHFFSSDFAGFEVYTAGADDRVVRERRLPCDLSAAGKSLPEPGHIIGLV